MRILGDVRLPEAVLSCLTSCFPVGTKVATPQGSVPIEKVKVGDRVLAEDPTTGKIQSERVEAVRHDPSSPLMEIDLADGSNIRATAEHPFWVDSGPGFLGPGWLEARHLRVGDQLRTGSGADVTVTGLRYNVGTADVYTLTVAADHDFFVGSARVLVHNCDQWLIDAAQDAADALGNLPRETRDTTAQAGNRSFISAITKAPGYTNRVADVQKVFYQVLGIRRLSPAEASHAELQAVVDEYLNPAYRKDYYSLAISQSSCDTCAELLQAFANKTGKPVYVAWPGDEYVYEPKP